MTHDLIIRNARLRIGKICDIAVSEGQIEQISDNLEQKAEKEIDAESNLVTEAFVIAHLHLDKVLTGSFADEDALVQYHSPSMVGAMTATEIASKVKDHYVESEIMDHVRSVLEDAEVYGVSHIRAFADVDTRAELTGIIPLLKIKDEFKGRIKIQIVALPEDGIVRDPGAEELLYKAMDSGADVVGGVPWMEYTNEDSKKHIDTVFEIAKKYDTDVAMLTDDAGDPDLRTTEYLAISTIRNAWIGRVSACHARASALYNEVHHRKFITLLKKARIGVVSNPHTGPLHARVRDLLNGGINVALGQDDVYDAYYKFGRCNMLEIAFLASHLLWMMTHRELEFLFDMVTVNPAKIMKIEDYGLAERHPANLVVLAGEDIRKVLAYHSEPRYVIKAGNVHCESLTTRKIGGARVSNH